MSIGNFRETSDSNDSLETAEAKNETDDVEKRRNQILETPDDHDDDFEKKLDDCESSQENSEQNTDDSTDSSPEKNAGEEKQSLLDKVRNLFAKKEETSTDESKDSGDSKDAEQEEPSKREKFLNSVRVEDYQAPNLDREKSDSSGESDETSENDDSHWPEHGEDGERTRWSDAQYAREHDRDDR